MSGLKIDLSGQHILLTGGSRGIGAGIARHLAQAGASLALHCRQRVDEAEALCAELPGKHRVFRADLADTEDCLRLWREATEWAGRIDCLINNAGIALSSPSDKPTEAWLTDWDRSLAVNLRAAALLSREAVAHFRAQGGGRLVHIASRAAFRGDTEDYLAYAASKGGMVALHRSLARACGKEGIRSFCIAPGFVRTDMAQDFMDAYGEEYALNDIALEHLTEPKDLGPAVALFASGLADHATGCTLDINAGSYVH